MKQLSLSLLLFIFFGHITGQSVTISGPSTVEVGITNNFTANITLAGKTVQSIAWEFPNRDFNPAPTTGNVSGQPEVLPNSTTASVKYGSFFAPTSVVAFVTVTFTDNSQVFDNHPITVNGIGPAEAISGPSFVQKCCDDPQSYSVINAGNGNAFQWSANAGWSIGTGTQTVTATPTTTGGTTISCRIRRNESVVDYFRDVIINVSRPNPAITAQTIPTSVCLNVASGFSVVPLCDASTYTWDFPGNDANWNKTGSGSSITVTPNENAESGTLTLTVDFSCAGVPDAVKTWNITAAGKPDNLMGGAYNCNGTLSWDNLQGASYFQVQWSPDQTNWYNITTNTTSDYVNVSNVLNGQTYYWRVRGYFPSCSAFGAYETSSFTSTYNSCPSPAGLVEFGITTNSVGLHWNSVMGEENYIVDYKKDNDPIWINASMSASNDVDFYIYGLECATIYDWRVRANCMCDIGSGPYSYDSFTTSAVTTCGTPAALGTAGLSQTTTGLYWNGATGANNYTIQYSSVSSSGPWASVTTSTSSASGSLSGLSCGTLYYWRVKANCNCSNGNYSSVATFTTSASSTCGTPTGLGTAGLSQTSTGLYWSGATGATGYTIQYSNVSSSGPFSTTSSTSPSVGLTNLTCGTLYYWKVKANCICGNGSYSSIAQFTTSAASSCGTPTSLYTSGVYADYAYLNWNSIAGASNYTLQYSTNGGSTWITYPSPINMSSGFVLNGLSCSTAYTWRVKANCQCQNGVYSSNSSFTTTTSSCSTPTGLTYTGGDYYYAYLNWSSVAGASNYTLQYSTNGGMSYFTYPTPVTSTFLFTGLQCSTTYHVRIKANCICANGSYCSPINFTTAAAPACNAPTGYLVGGVGFSDASIYWNPVQGANSYRIEKSLDNSFWSPAATAHPDNYYTFTSLTPQTLYYWRVRANCSCASSSYVGGSFNTGTNYMLTTYVSDENPQIPGTNNLTSNNEVQIYPNPSREFITMDIQSEEEGFAQVSIYNLMGEVILYNKISLTSGLNRKSFSLERFPTGQYLITIQTSENVITRQIQVIK